MGIIDAHTHFFPDAVAEKAIPKMQESSGVKPWHDGTMAGLLASMDGAGIEKSVVLQVATNPEKVSAVNRFSASVDHPGIKMTGALHPKSPDWQGDLDEMLNLGFRLLKLHPDYQGFSVGDPSLLPFFAAVRDAGAKIIFHSGQDPSYVDPFGGPPHMIAALLDKLPGLVVQAAHMGGYRMWDEVEQCLLGRENVLIDTSFSFGIMPDKRIRNMILRHGTDRVLFGTDSPWCDQTSDVVNIRGLNLGDEVEEKIFTANAMHWLY
jgi:hypothetical protein